MRLRPSLRPYAAVPAMRNRVLRAVGALPEMPARTGAGRFDGWRADTCDRERPGSAPARPNPARGAAGRSRLWRRCVGGGVALVYRREPTEPIRRRVAVKVIRRGAESGTVLAGFEAERQALALLNHPNIAKIFDAGTTDEGRPFFVMEY